MGLDVSHGCWHGPYSAFNRFRQALALQCGGSFPPHAESFRLEDGSEPEPTRFYFDYETVPKEHTDGALAFLGHPDDGGILTAEEAKRVAAWLRWCEPRIGDSKWDIRHGFKKSALRFAGGCEIAAAQGEDVTFG